MQMFADIPIFEYEVIDSTQNAAKQWFQSQNQPPAKGTMLSAHIAKSQTKGRGRRDRVWLDNKKSLLVTFVVSPKDDHFFFEVAKILLSLQEVLKSNGVPSTLKWPNDVVVETETGYKKLGGCLSEIEDSHLFIGLGINISSIEEKIHSNDVGSLDEYDFDIEAIELLKMILQSYKSNVMDSNELKRQYLKECSTISKSVKITSHNQEIFGTAIGISESGALILNTDEGTFEVFEGDVIHLRNQS